MQRLHKTMGFRVLLLLVAGLGAMYMMHLLAQDYNRIRQPVQTATRLLSQASSTLTRRKREQMATIDWKRILSRDPFECLQSLICQLMSGVENSSTEAINMIDFLEANLNMVPDKISRAFSRGLAFRGAAERCYDEYPFCIYSAKTMLQVLRWFANMYDTNLAN